MDLAARGLLPAAGTPAGIDITPPLGRDPKIPLILPSRSGATLPWPWSRIARQRLYVLAAVYRVVCKRVWPQDSRW